MNYNELSNDELKKLIYELIEKKYKGIVSRYTIEGILLYTCKCSHNKMYRILMESVLDEKLFLVELSDGQYYKLNENGRLENYGQS